MQKFNYEGRNQQGQKVSGLMNAASAQAVAAQLAEQGIIPLQIGLARGAAQTAAGEKSKNIDLGDLFKPRRVNIEELIIFSRQMFSLSKAGIPVVRALQGLGESMTNAYFKGILLDIAHTLESGVDLASALSRHPTVFADFYVSVIHVGENTGRLDLSFKQVANYLELERDTKKRIGTATRYPLFVMIAILIAIGVINVLVVPAFARLFESFNADLPWQTRLLIGMSNVTMAYWPWILASIAATVFGTRHYISTQQGRFNWDRIKLRVPLVGAIFERITLGRFARTYAMVLQAGVPVVQALTIVANSVGNSYMATRIMDMRRLVERGESFSRTAIQSKLFTPLVLQMISVGEETGNMDELLDEVADFYEQEVDYDLKSLSDKIEPIMLMVVAGMVLVLALGVFLPMWDLSSAVQGR